MQRWQGAALAAALCSGCLDPLVDDQPGYSPLLLAPQTQVPSAYADALINRKIDTNDGLGMGPIALKSGFAAGSKVEYWDLGAARRPAPVYLLYDCVANKPISPPHAPIVESIPGDVDYSPFRAMYRSCVTPTYAGQLVTSVEALADAVELGLLTDLEPVLLGDVQLWRNMPIVSPSAETLSFGTAMRTASQAYFDGKIVLFHHFTDQEGDLPNPAKMPPPGYAFEVVRADAPTTVLRTIFSQPYRAADGSRNLAYTPQWTVVTVTLKARNELNPNDAQEEELELATYLRDTDLVMYGPTGAPIKKTGTRVGNLQIASTRVNRPFFVNTVVSP